MNTLHLWSLASDADLVAQVRAGKRDAYGELVRRHQEALYRHACGMGLDHDTSLDLVQDAFVKGFTRLNDCKDPAHVRAWLYRILRNLCLDYLKNVRRADVSLEDADVADVADYAEAVSINDALARLPIAMREAFLLKHDAQYTYEEIAELTDSSPSAVKMRVHRARELLQNLLSDKAVA